MKVQFRIIDWFYLLSAITLVSWGLLWGITGAFNLINQSITILDFLPSMALNGLYIAVGVASIFGLVNILELF